VGAARHLLLPVTALVDSGADSSTFPVAMMGVLGVSLSQCVEGQCTTPAGPAPMYTYPPGLRAQLDGTEVHLAGTFTPGQTVLLGRADFFSRYLLVGFNERAQTFMLTTA
jgi:hypothetical protein